MFSDSVQGLTGQASPIGLLLGFSDIPSVFLHVCLRYPLCVFLVSPNSIDRGKSLCQSLLGAGGGVSVITSVDPGLR